MPRKSGPPTLRDIAAEVGVTASTVSAVLNDAPKAARYTEATKARIRETAKRLGYMANPMAQALRGQSPRLLGFISFNVNSTYYGHVLSAIEEVAESRAHQVVVANMQRNRDRLDPCIQLMLQWRVRGILLASIGNAIGDPLERALEALTIPMVNMGHPDQSSSLPCVNFDNAATGKILAQHLYNLGHVNTVMLSGPRSLEYFESRCASFESTMAQLAPDSQCTVVEMSMPSNLETAYRATCELVRSGRQFTALVGANDTIAVGAMRALAEHGVGVPEEVSVAGVDDVSLSGGESEGTRLAAYLYPSLTTVRVPVSDIARTGATRLLDLVEHGSDTADPVHTVSPGVVLLPPTLIHRESTARAKG